MEGWNWPRFMDALKENMESVVSVREVEEVEEE